jgi:hypothetical protein
LSGRLGTQQGYPWVVVFQQSMVDIEQSSAAIIQGALFDPR